MITTFISQKVLTTCLLRAFFMFKIQDKDWAVYISENDFSGVYTKQGRSL